MPTLYIPYYCPRHHRLFDYDANLRRVSPDYEGDVVIQMSIKCSRCNRVYEISFSEIEESELMNKLANGF